MVFECQYKKLNLFQWIAELISSYSKHLTEQFPNLKILINERAKPEHSGIAKRAFTANKWSRRSVRSCTCSSKFTFSVRSWCKHESNEATVMSKKIMKKCIKYKKNIIQYTHCQSAELVPWGTEILVPTASPRVDRDTEHHRQPVL